MNRNSNETSKLYDWYHELERKNKNSDISPMILRKIENTDNVRNRISLMSILEFEYSRHGRHYDALNVIREQILIEPENPIHLIHLSENLLYFDQNTEEAQVSIEKAILLADKTKNYRRHARATKARIAIASCNYAMLEKCLNEIVDIQLNDGQLDVGRERDLLDRAPEGALSKKIVKRYEAYLNE